MTFGQLLSSLRQQQGLSLREFATKIGYDASNISRVERGVGSPPKSSLILRKWADVLELKQESKDRNDFMALGMATTIQHRVKSEAELVKLMPAFFRTVENRRIDPKTYKRLKDILYQNT